MNDSIEAGNVLLVIDFDKPEVVIRPAKRVRFGPLTLHANGLTTKGDFEMVTLKDTDTGGLLRWGPPVDAKGNPAPVQDLAVSLSASVGGAVTFTPDADNLGGRLDVTGALGTGTVTISADADLGDGVVTITDSVNIEVIATQATGFGASGFTPDAAPAAPAAP